MLIKRLYHKKIILDKCCFKYFYGFCENQKVILAKTIAEIHGVNLDYVNKLVTRNITRFNEADLIDLKSKSLDDLQLLSLGFTNMQRSKSNNIYLLSELLNMLII